MKKQKGFTLVETIVALFIGVVMLLAIYEAVNVGQISASKVERRIGAQQDVRGALELMAMEIQMASFNPLLKRNIWVNSTNCSGVSSNQAYKGIQAATTTSITIEMDLNANGVINNNPATNPNETITYNYDATNQYITRTTNCTGGDQPFLGAGSGADADTKNVLVVNNTAGPSNAAIPVFTYYDGSGNNISGTVVSAPSDITSGIPAIRRIVITLVADTSSRDIGGARKRIIYSTSVVPRNHTVPDTVLMF